MQSHNEKEESTVMVRFPSPEIVTRQTVTLVKRKDLRRKPLEEKDDESGFHKLNRRNRVTSLCRGPQRLGIEHQILGR